MYIFDIESINIQSGVRFDGFFVIFEKNEMKCCGARAGDNFQ